MPASPDLEADRYSNRQPHREDYHIRDVDGVQQHREYRPPGRPQLNSGSQRQGLRNTDYPWSSPSSNHQGFDDFDSGPSQSHRYNQESRYPEDTRAQERSSQEAICAEMRSLPPVPPSDTESAPPPVVDPMLVVIDALTKDLQLNVDAGETLRAVNHVCYTSFTGTHL